MRKEIFIGIICGSVTGIVDLIPMIIQKLPWNADLSALSMWIIIGFFIATSQITMNSILKGILIAILCFLPNTFIIGLNDPFKLIRICIITIILGGLLGFSVRNLSDRIVDKC